MDWITSEPWHFGDVCAMRDVNDTGEVQVIPYTEWLDPETTPPEHHGVYQVRWVSTDTLSGEERMFSGWSMWKGNGWSPCVTTSADLARRIAEKDPGVMTFNTVVWYRGLTEEATQ